jgi:hypothetical protein
MSSRNDEAFPPEVEACYDSIASQEEIYLEEIGEEVRARFISIDLLESRNGH